MKNTQKWVIGGGVLAVIIVAAVVFANPQLQKGLLQLAPTRKPNVNVNIPGTSRGIPTQSSQNLLRGTVAVLPDCGSNDYRISVLYTPHQRPSASLLDGPPPVASVSIPSSRNEDGRIVFGEFAIIPNGCKLDVRDIDFTWTELSRTTSREVYVKDPVVRIYRGDNLLHTTAETGYVCFINQPLSTARSYKTYIHSDAFTIIPGQPYTSFVVSGTVDSEEKDSAGGRNPYHYYGLNLVKVNDRAVSTPGSAYDLFVYDRSLSGFFVGNAGVSTGTSESYCRRRY